MRMHTIELPRIIREVCGDPQTGAEIGVFKGEMAKILLSEFPTCHITFVDPWREWYPGSSYYDNHVWGLKKQEEWDSIKRQALDTIFAFPERHQILQMLSEEAAPLIEERSLDFVYIDANHSYEFVKKDIEVWLPKTRKLLCGHDYLFRPELYGRNRVALAVHEMLGEDEVILREGKIWAYRIPQ